MNRLASQTAIRVAVAVALLLLLGLGLKLWGDSRYRAGKAHENAVWQAANDKLIQQAATSAREADRKEAIRIRDHSAQLEQERNRIDAAIANGASPADAIFPVGDSVQP